MSGAIQTGIAKARQLNILDRTKLLVVGVCPECGRQAGFLEGPHGGNCTNIKCKECGAEYNVFPPFFAERI